MRSNRSTKRLSEILNKENTILSKLFHKADVLQQLDKEISDLMPPAVAGKAKVANISRYEVIIHITSAALLTRLRLQQKQLMLRINQRYTWAHIEKVTIKVRPTPQKKPPIHRTQRPHRSDKIASDISLAALACNNPGLRNSLQKLAEHVKSKHNIKSLEPEH